jgi:hypothetical protein
MRSILVSTFILLTSASLAPAAPVVITSGSISNFFDTTPEGGFTLSLSSANLTVNFREFIANLSEPPIPAVCNSFQFVNTSCTFSPSYTDNSVPMDGAVVNYNGTLYLGGTLARRQCDREFSVQ